MKPAFRPLTPVFGAEVSGVDLAGAIDADTFAAIEQAFETYSVLVFHDQHLTDEQQVAFSERFGSLESTVASAANAAPTRVAVISNVGPDGNLLPIDSRKMKFHSGNEMWHSDSSFKVTPAKASLLSAREIPPVDGDTEFASLRAAYDALMPAEAARLDGLIAVHSYTYSRGLIDPTLFTPEQAAGVPPVRQRVVRVNPKNGRRALFLGSHASHIEGMPVDEGRRLLKELLDRATAPEFTYRHRWRPHDLVMWDNRATLHRACGWDAARYRRTMHRTTVAGEQPGVEAPLH